MESKIEKKDIDRILRAAIAEIRRKQKEEAEKGKGSVAPEPRGK